MKILITGADGQLGKELSLSFERGYTSLGVPPILKEENEIIKADLATLDITDRDRVMCFVKAHKPEVIINCAAFTNVNACESERDTAYNVNAYGAENLALASNEVDATLVHISTDYVFSGDKGAPYTEDDIRDPINEYGKSKLLGENLVSIAKRLFIVRTSWLYGLYGSNFVKTILKKAKESGELSVVSDQYGTPTSAMDLAHHILLLLGTEAFGTYHASGVGVCSWYDFAKEAIRLYELDTHITPCTTMEYPTPARRPKYSALENRNLEGLGLNQFRDWQDSLCAFIKELKGKE